MSSNPSSAMNPTDLDVRRRVLDLADSFIVQAPAGSGKTELLMQRFLVVMADPQVTEPESVLAITFTRKAANEMRNRVLEALEAASKPEPRDLADHKKLTRMLAVKALERDQACGWHLLQNPSRLQVRTVDSFCESLVRRLPFEAGFGGSVEIEPDPVRLYDEAARRTVLLLGDTDPQVSSAVSALLAHLDGDVQKMQRLLAGMLAKREQWLRLIGSAAFTQQDLQVVRNSLELALMEAVRYELTLLRECTEQHLPASRCQELFSLMRYAASQVEPGDTLRQLVAIDELPGADPAQLGIWRAMDKFLFDTARKVRGKLDKRHGFPTTDRAKKEACQNLLKTLAADPQFSAAVGGRFSRLAVLPPTSYTDAQWEFVQALFSVLPRAAATLKTIFAEERCVDFSEVAQGAARALGGADPTDLGLSLGARLRHVLVDEFQDTSIAQIELLKAVTAAWEPGAGNTIFVVGDPMQSIYGFREAEVVLFQRTRQAGIDGWVLRPQELRVNFRSQAGLIEWFNSSFPCILTENNVVTGAVSYAQADAIHPAVPDAVQIHPFPTKNYEAEAALVADLAQKELGATERGTVAILLRARSHAAQIVKALQSKGIGFRAIDIDPLSGRQAVLDIDALTQAVLHLEDRTSWLAVLRAPWCGLELADLLVICNEDRHSTVWELLRARQHLLSARGQQVMKRILPVLDCALANRGRAPLRDWVESTWVSLGGPAACYTVPNPEAAVRDTYAYLDLLQQVETAGELPPPQLFRRKLDELYAPVDSSDKIRVEIMTIHSAKGLQFDAVIIPGLGRKPKEDDSRLLYWQERVLEGQAQLLLAPIEAAGAEKKTATIEGYLRKIQKDRTCEESKRLLYVAATRAQRRLHLLGHLPASDQGPASSSLLKLLFEVPEVAAAFKAAPVELAPAATPGAAPQVQPHPLYRLPVDWKLPTVPAELKWDSPDSEAAESTGAHTFDWVGETLRRVGTVTHAFLQQIGREGLAHWNNEHIQSRLPAIRAALLSEGVSSVQLGDAVTKVVAALRATLQDQKGRWILDAHSDARSEFEISGMVDGQIRRLKIDRTFTEDGARWIIDFKITDIAGSGKDAFLQSQVEKYRADLERYARVMQQLDARPVHAGLYFPLLKEFRQIS